jgi:hypothetical protein
LLYQTAPLWVLMIGYWAIAIASHINIGLRHLLPAFGPMLILIGVCGPWLTSEVRLLGLLTKGILAAAILECLLAWPNYLAYFNVFAGGTDNAYKHLVDSSLDWGQDLPGLREWLLKNRATVERQPVYLSYFGTASPTWYGLVQSDLSEAKLRPAIVVQRLPGFYDLDIGGVLPFPTPLQGGVYCISATMLQKVGPGAPSPWIFAYEQSYQELRAPIQNLLKLGPQKLEQELRRRPTYWGPICHRFHSAGAALRVSATSRPHGKHRRVHPDLQSHRCRRVVGNGRPSG